MPFPTNIANLATRISTEFRTIRTLITGTSTGNISGLNTTNKSSLVSAINEVNSKPSGGATNLDGLTDVTITNPVEGHILRRGSTEWVNVPGTDYYQPLNSNLTAIAALATTAYGRAFLVLADQAGLMGLLRAATDSLSGVTRYATTSEAQTGTDTATALTPAGGKAHLDSRISTNVALGTSNTLVPSQGAVKAYADGLLAANDALVFKGGIDASANPNFPAADAGHMYKITVAGKIGGSAGPNVEVGDTIICGVDGSAAGTAASVGNNWIILQTNIDGAVVGPGTSVAGRIVTFAGTTGKVIQDSGISVTTDGTLATNTNAVIPTVLALRTYLDANYYTKTQIGDPETNYVTAFETALSA